MFLHFMTSFHYFALKIETARAKKVVKAIFEMPMISFKI